jgi:ABC-type transport system involved in cytochrome c biogenesis permease subunit
MSSETPNEAASADPTRPESFGFEAPPNTSLIEVVRPVLGPLSSLKLAVSMFACSLFLVMIGTLAQVDADIWDVVAQYFRCWFAWVPLRTLHPLFARIESIEPIRDFFHGLSPSIGIWFPGGFLIGAVMTVNLVSAFIMKFHIQAKGNRLTAGLAVSSIGLFGIGLAVASGDSQTGLQEAGIAWDTLWMCLQVLTVALLAVNIWGIYDTCKKKMPERIPLIVSVGLLTFAGYWLFTLEKRFDDSSMRILWQLIKGEAPALVLLVGFIMLFKKRGGVVLIHAGIALMMFNEVLVHVEHIETQMSIEEGETVNFAEDVRSLELALVDTTSDPKNNKEILVPRDLFDSTHATFAANLAEQLSRSASEAKGLSGDAHRESGNVPQGAYAEMAAALASLEDIPVEDEIEAAHQEAVAALEDVTEKREAVEEIAARRTVMLAPVTALIEAAESTPDEELDKEAREEKVAAIRKDHKSQFDQAADLAAEMHALLPELSQRLTIAETAVRKLVNPLRVVISDEKLPFDLRIDRFMQNSDLRDLRRGEDNLATAGSGLNLKAAAVRAGVGTDTGGAIDLTSAYVTLLDRETKKELGTYLLGVYFQLINDTRLEPNTIEYKGQTWDLALRFERHYKPYSVYLSDVSKKDYIGTSTPRDYRSVVTITEEDGTSFERDIWMNNPLRYAGETFYQSNYTAANPRTGEAEKTTLQVVRNTGWMVPYVSCMIVGTGLLAHFWSVLIRFLRRRGSARTLKIGILASVGAMFGWVIFPAESEEETAEDEDKKKSSGLASKFKPAKRADDLVELEPKPRESAVSLAVSVVLALCVAGWLYGKAVPKSVDEGEANLKAFGELPLVYEGRTKPFDTLARNSLRVLSNRTTFITQVEVKDNDGKVVKDDDGKPKMKDVKNPAILWLLDVMSDPEAAGDHKVFRIENPQVQKTLGLERRKGFMYSLKEFYKKLPDLAKEAQVARDKDDGKRSADERKLLELESKIGVLDILMNSFSPPSVPEIPRDQDPMAIQQYFMNLQRVKQGLDRFDGRQPPLSVPPVAGEESDEEEAILATDEWQTFSRGWFNSYLQVNIQGQDPSEPVKLFTEILVAHSKRNADDYDPNAFNEKVAEYRRWLDRNGPEDLSLEKASFETYFNEFAPAYYSAFSYLAAFIFAAIALLGWSKPLNRAALLTIILTFFVHSFTLLARMEISGRPPVTNLYSSAVFIGWGGVLIGIVFEAFYKNGIGNVIGSALGAATLGIAYLLSGDGDTFKVLQAVLDTQFWLATHVVCITMGYATTFIAGTLGQYYVLTGFASRKITPAMSKDLSRMIYGTVCFGIFFSFVGTVLGGLWADDSWGRFWGWDPKENGALLIVIWNVLLLHARWDGMVKDRGFAVLAVVGNIITSWSWFGVNELGVGLHSYGFTSGVWSTLWLFWLSQFVVCGIGMMPRRFWTSFRAWDRTDETAA